MLKKILFIIALLVLVACSKDKDFVQVTGKDGQNGHDGQDGSSCTVQQVENGAKILCTDGSFAYIYNGRDGVNGQNGEDGTDGINGVDGKDGSSCSISGNASGASITCSNGTSATILNGLNGSNGTNGINGTNGANGQSCTLQDLANGVKITCGSQSAIVYDGEDADSSVIGIKEYIKPCGNEFPNDEIFLRLTDGNILALYDGGPNLDRLVLLAPGNYITTDRNGRTCNFTVTNDLKITNERVQ